MMTNTGFTLIELLVVVLIIGILAAVALPQYQKAVWKSRTVHLRTVQNSLATAQNAYFMANSTHPTSFDELAVNFDNLTSADQSTLGANIPFPGPDSVRYNELFEIYLGTGWNHSWFRTGKYKGCGFGIDYQTGKWYCKEWWAHYHEAAGSFCQKVMGTGNMSSEQSSVRYYPM